MILTQEQAKVVHNALVTLDGVSANSGTAISFVGSSDEGMARYTCTESANGEIEVIKGPTPACRVIETYRNRSAFAVAYGLVRSTASRSNATSSGLVF
jgi:hypothetical protein